MSNGRRVWLRSAVGVGLGAACLWAVAARVDPDELAASFSRLRPGWLVVAVFISLGIQLLRAWRWKVELSVLAELDYWTTWKVVSVSYMMINVLPFRLGEPVRPLLMAWKSGLRVPAIVGNWVFEKMMDAAAMVFFVHLALLSADLPDWAGAASRGSLALFGLMVALVAGYWLGGDQLIDSALGRLLPTNASRKVSAALSSAREGLSVLPNTGLVALVALLTLALWSLPVLSSWVLILAFDFDLPFAAALAVFVAIGAGTALPNPPGMVGVFQVATVVALGLFGVPLADAVAYGLLLNAIQLITLVAQGLVALSLLGPGAGEATRRALSENAESS